MTYVIGFKQPGVNAIISDARGSWRGIDGRWYGDNTALKTGLLFPGCIYGVMGNPRHANELILGFKRSVGGERDSHVLWKWFQDVVGAYGFTKGESDGFQILLSNRSSGQPVFYLLDSTSGISRVRMDAPYMVNSYGSGKTVLDRFVGEKSELTLKGLQAHLVDDKGLPTESVHEVSPYFLCLWLSEWSLTYEKSRLEKHGVGGAFHFVYQTDEFESAQKPAVYIFSAANPRTKAICSWLYRVVYVQGGLYLECHTLTAQDAAPTPGPKVEKYVLLSTAAQPYIEAIDQDQLRDIIMKGLESQPFWFFWGIGYTNRLDRSNHFFNVSGDGKREDVLGEDGRLAPEVRRLIESGFTGERLPWVSDVTFE